ncbi:NUDIX domain-containing protein [Agrococcus sp. TSP3-2-1]|uniref:NUDIX domain-containing protein n=1 Tax=Agrococcus sp. TSP3-2-1 TaxID=2804583 RepID=UPI003CE9E943
MSPILAASGGVTDDAGRFLLVRRRHPAEAGRWSVPGGSVEPGETMPQAVAREVLEETGIVVTVGRSCVDRSYPGVFDLEDAVLELDDGAALRHGLLYGPGTWYSRDGANAQIARDGTLTATA